MATNKVSASIEGAIRDLNAERAVIDKAIEQLEELLADLKTVPATRRGAAARKAKRKTARSAAKTGARKKRSTKGWTAAKRRAAAARMRKYWAGQRKTAPKKAGKKAGKKATKKKAGHGRKKAVKRTWTPQARRAAAERARKQWAARKSKG